MSEPVLSLRWAGGKADDPETVGEIMQHFGGLLREVTRSVCGDADAIKWRIGQIRIVCDGCERIRPEDHRAWVKREGLDFCPACQTPEMSPASEGGS